MEVSDAKRLKGLEGDNRRLKKLLAEAMLDNAMLKDVALKKGLRPLILWAKREAVAHLNEGHNVIEQWVCAVLDALTDGRRLRIVALIDDYSRECLSLVADTPLSGARVARELDILIMTWGKLKTIVLDNGTDLINMAILKWSESRAVGWHYIAPGQRQYLSGKTPLWKASIAVCGCLRD